MKGKYQMPPKNYMSVKALSEINPLTVTFKAEDWKEQMEKWENLITPLVVNQSSPAIYMTSTVTYPEVDKVYFNGLYTTVIWKDRTKTIVKCQENEEYDKEKALAMCFMKKAMGNKGNFNDKMNELIDPDFKKKRKEARKERHKQKKIEKELEVEAKKQQKTQNPKETATKARKKR